MNQEIYRKEKEESWEHLESANPFKDNQRLTLVFGNRTWRSSLIIAFISCYLMWFITFMAQLHPLIAPRRVDIKEGFQHE